MKKLLTLLLAVMATTATLFAESGTCGPKLNWDLTDGVLTISGTGLMTNYNVGKQPWSSQLKSITKVVVEEGVTSIGNTAFRGCAMTTISLPNTLESIGNTAISKCEQLTSVTIPSNVTNIGAGAFNASSGLTEIICEAITPPTCGSSAFGGVTNTIPVYVPDASVSAYMSAPEWNVFTNIKGIDGGGGEAATSGTCGENVNWDLTDGVLTISGTGAMTDYTNTGTPWYYKHASITSVIVEDGVTTIGKYAFYDCAITMVSLPNTLTTIGNYVFYNCSALTSVTLPNSITTIGIGAFRNCGITEITLSNSLTNIGSYAISLCPNLTSITIPATVTNIDDAAFKGCTGLTEIICEAITPPTCGTYVFEGVTNTIPVYVPAGTDNLYKAADGWKNFTNIKGVASGKCGANVNWDLTGDVLTISGTGYMTSYTSPSKRPWHSFASSITSVVIEEGVMNIGESAFEDFSSLTSVTIPNSLEVLEGYAFFGCSALSSVTIPDNIMVIGNSTFKYCSALTTITIPADVNYIKYQAFSGCTGLTEIICEATTPPTCEDLVFEGITNTIPVYVPAESLEAYKVADGWNYFTNIKGASSGTCGENVTWDLTGGVLTISGTGPMNNFTLSTIPWNGERASIVSIIIEDGVTTIGNYAFIYCDGLTSVMIGNSVISIGEYAFFGCGGLTSVTIPNSVTSIGKSAFCQCFGLTSVTIGNSVTSIGDQAFMNCFSLTSVTIPNSVTSIGNEVFSGCGSLTSFNVASENSNYSSLDGVLFNKDKTILIQYPAHKEGAYTIPNSVTNIGKSAFSYCTGLTSVTIGNSVTSIGWSAFASCEGLTKITCEATTPPTLEDQVFEYVPKSIPVYVPAESLEAYKVADGWNYFTNITIPLTPEEQVEVNKVIDLINAIFDAPITLDNEAAIIAARNAYDALSSLLQTAVINYDLLQYAEKTLAALKANIPTVDDNWVFYDNGVYNTSYNTGGNEAWAIFIPANTTSKKSILRINTYIHVPGEYEVEFYAGGATPAEGTKLSSEVVSMPNADEFNEVTLSNPVPIDPTQDIWVVMKNINGYSAPMTACDLTGAVNASWFLDGTSWTTTADVGITNVAWMIRVFFATYTGEALIDGIRYYLSGDDMTAEVMPLGDGYYAGDIVLPEKVSYLKNDYAVTSVAGAAFSNCPELLTVTIPKSVNWIEPEVFYNSPKLTAVNVAAANANYSSLDGVLFNKAQTELRAYPTAKEGAYIVPEGVETIMDATFAENKKLTAVTLPASLYEIASRAFENCTGLEMIACRATNVPYLGGDVFAGVNKAIPVFVPKANIALYKAEYEWEDFTNYIAIEDKEAADAVIAKINAIGTVTYTPECKARIDAARGGYDALTAEQKVYITDATYKILTDAEKAYADLKAKAEADQAAANAVIGKIDAIGTVTLESEAAILDARSAYNALTAAQQALVTNYSVLTAAEAKLEILKKQAESDEAAAKAVTDLINAIGTVTYTSESKARIDAAREAYDALTAVQKALVTNLTTLTAAEKAYADLKAKAEADQAAANIVIGKINAIGTVTYTPESKALIDAAREAYDALTDAQKGLVSAATYKILTDAEQTYADLKKKAEADLAAANIVIGKINAIGTVTLSSEAAILDARSAYDALTAAQQVLVTNYGVLTAAEKAYADLKAKAEADQAAANVVINQIDAIGEVTLASEPAIVAARGAYNALTAAQQALVTNYSVLTAAEAKLEILKKQAESDEAAAHAVTDLIDAIGTVTLESEAAINAARSAYDALTAAQQLLVTNLSTLTAAEKKLAELKANAEAVANAKLQLKTIVSQANELKMVAMLYAPTTVSDIDAIINDAQSTIDDPNATVDQINAKAATLTDNLNTLAVNLLEQAKEQLKQSLRDLYQPGDYPSWYASAIIPALDQVDGITWDFNKSVQDNILYFQVTGQNLYNATKAALEALRGTDKRSIISSCAFTGFENGIKVDMTWNISALNNLINTLNTSVASEPYHLDAEMSSLGKWDPVTEELIILDPYEAQKLTAGDYQFITAVKIDGKDAKQYRLPKATEEVLSVTVDAAVWAVDLSGIVIDANYSFTYVTSPMFTISKSEDVELIEIEPVKTQKIFHNGHFYIIRGEHIYDLQGTRVK